MKIKKRLSAMAVSAAVVSQAAGAPLWPEEKPFQFFNVVRYAPGEEKQTAREIIELRKLTGIDTPLYSLTLNPQGKPAWLTVEQCVNSYRKLKAALKGSGVRLGVLIQAILGHRPVVEKESENWTRAVNIDGEKTRFCPFDPDFRKYIFDMVVLLAKEQPSFILSDDDVRGFSPKAECFCPLHTAEFNRRNHTDFTPESYRKAIAECSENDPLYKACEALRIDTVASVTRLVREAIDSVDPSIPSGVCMPGRERVYAKPYCLNMAGKNQIPVMRVGNAMYGESSPKLLPANILSTQALAELYPGIRLLDEADTYPQQLISRSALTMHTKLGTSIFSGLTGAKLWYVNGRRDGIPVSYRYTSMLSLCKNYYQELTKAVQGTHLCGIVSPAFKRDYHLHIARPTPPDANGSPALLNSWGANELGLFGIPFLSRIDFTQDGIYMLGGKECIDRLSDADLKEIFRHRVFVDGVAVRELTKRGFAESMGVRAVEKPMVINREYGFGLDLQLSCGKAAPYLELLSPKCKVLTDLCFVSRKGIEAEKVIQKVAPGTVFFENASGGKVIATVAVSGNKESSYLAVRRQWLVKVLEQLYGEALPYRYAGEEPVTLLHRTSVNGDLLMLVSMSFDQIAPVSFHCSWRPNTVEYLTIEGKWERLSFDRDGDTITIRLRINCCESVVLRIR